MENYIRLLPAIVDEGEVSYVLAYCKRDDYLALLELRKTLEFRSGQVWVSAHKGCIIVGILLVYNHIHQRLIGALKLETDLVLPTRKVLFEVDSLIGLKGYCSREGVAPHRVDLLVTNPSKIAAFTKALRFLALPVHAWCNTFGRGDSFGLEVKNGKYPKFQLESP